MSLQSRVRTSDRPPEVVAEEGNTPRTQSIRPMGPRVRRSRNGWGVVLAMGMAFLWVAAASATDPRPRGDPGDPPIIPGGTDEGWWVQTIPGLPAEARLGDLWVSNSGAVYVWATFPTSAGARAAALEEPAEGERLPGGHREPSPLSSAVYRFDGLRWTMMFRAPGETGVALYGTDDDNVFASTNGALGEARLYRFDGRTWSAQVVPGYHLGRLHTMAGVRGDFYFRIDRVLLRDRGDGHGLQPVFEEPGDHVPVRGLVYMGAGQVVLMHADGHSLYHDGVWSDRTAAPFAQVEDVWGAADAEGRMQLFALGSTEANAGIRLWQFIEENPADHSGHWSCVLADPAFAAVPGTGCGLHVWGRSVGDVYATGMCEGESHLLRRDGAAWTQISPPTTLGAVHGVWGTPTGDVWFSADRGRVVRYQRAPVPVTPAVVSARPALTATTSPAGVELRYDLAEDSPVRITLHDVTGRWCATLAQEQRTRGSHQLVWAAGGLRPGVYFIRFQSARSALNRRIVLLR